MTVAATAVTPGMSKDRTIMPVSPVGEWQIVNNDPATAQTSPQQIYTQIASGGSDLIPMKMAELGTSFEFTCQYDPSAGKTTTTGPVVWAVGVSPAGVCRRLSDAAGTKEWTMSADTSNDCASAATAYYTLPIVVDSMGSERVFLLVKTGASGTAWPKGVGGAILAHVL